MDIAPDDPSGDYVANLSAKLIIFIKSMVIEYATIAPDYIAHPRGQQPNVMRQMKENAVLNKQSL